jgi:hypothetical protein
VTRLTSALILLYMQLENISDEKNLQQKRWVNKIYITIRYFDFLMYFGPANDSQRVSATSTVFVILMSLRPHLPNE